ncbi:Ig-like domain-containing protein, partial [Metapseudomonas furukawaii]
WVINIDATAPDAPTIGKVMDNEGEVGEVIHGGVTDDSTPTFSGQAEKGATVIIYDKGVEIGRETADPVSGEWTFTPNPKLDEGAHSITVKAMDAAGNISEESPAFEFELIPAEEVVPSAPVIESVYDDAGDVTGELSPGDVTDDKRPVFSGQSDPFATVIIYNDDGVEIARGQADKDGRWTAEPTTDLIDGVYNFTAVAESAAGTSSEPSEPFEVILYTGNGPHQVARLSHMGKDSGQDGQDFVTDNGSFGRLMHGVLSAELAAGQSLQVSTDGGKTWFDALVKGTDWAAQDLNAHTDDWTIQTRVVG